MAIKASPTVIGGFVVGAIALIVIGLLVFGSGKFFQVKRDFVAHFPGSVQGLRIGAPVTFRGAQIGQVTAIKIIYNEAAEDFRIPVVFEILPERFVTEGEASDALNEVDEEEDLRKLIDQGLRAQLNTQSMVTGLLYVDLQFAPDTPVDLVGTRNKNLLEVPTIPSSLDEIQQTMGTVLRDVPSLVAELGEILTTLNDDLEETSGDFKRLVADLAEVAERVRRSGKIEKIIDDGVVMAAKLRSAATTVDSLLTDNRDQVGALITQAAEAAGAARRMADQINNAIAENRQGLEDFTTVGLYEWTGLAQDAQAAVAQFQRVGEELERNPSRFLFGGQDSGMRPEE